MVGKEIMKEAIRESKTSQTLMAKKLGVSASTVSTNLRRDNMGIDIFSHYLNQMGFKVYVGVENDGEFVPEWELTPGNTEKREVRMKVDESDLEPDL